jgi:hypothetical protein
MNLPIPTEMTSAIIDDDSIRGLTESRVIQLLVAEE